MKKTLFYCLAGSCLVLAGFLVVPVGAAAAEIIRDYRTDIRINLDSSFNVRETIVYDFGPQQKHGIYRKIPYKYKARGGNFEYRYSGFRVADGSGRSVEFKKSTEDGNLVLKIGDPDRTITGQNTYVISYKVKRGINFFKDHDELYWNVIGDKWPVAIEKASASVIIPDGSYSRSTQTECFYGTYGSTSKCQMQTEGSAVSFTSPEALTDGSGMTVVVGLPKGVLREPSSIEKAWDVFRDNGILLLPFLAVGVMYYLWNTRGRDPQGRGAIIAQFEPPKDLTPLEASVIVDEKFDNKDISAAIVDLAIRGYLRIVRTEEKGFLTNTRDYRLEKLKSEADLPANFEKRIMQGLFGSASSVKLSTLKSKFYEDLKEIRDEVYKNVSKEYFEGDPNTTRGVYIAIGIAGLVICTFIGEMIGTINVISVAASSLAVAAFGYFMPRRTAKGVEFKEYILGLKRYMSVAEKDRINFHNAPAKNPEHFEKLLPYAMMLGVEKEWAKQFEGIYTQPPSWYSDPSGQMFSAAGLTDSLHSFSTASSNITSAPSGGSGFSGGGSGGGGGGGGGGSW